MPSLEAAEAGESNRKPQVARKRRGSTCTDFFIESMPTTVAAISHHIFAFSVEFVEVC